MSVQIPDTPLGAQLGWLIDLLRSGGQAEPEDLRQRLSTEFLAAAPPEQLVLALGQAAGLMKSFEVDSFEGEPSETAAVAVLTLPTGDVFRLRMSVDAQPPHRIQGMLIQPAPDLRKEPAARSWEELESKLAPLAAQVGFSAAEIVEGGLAPVFEMQPEAPLAIGSAFKLYVLGELARQIVAGKASWDEELLIEEARRSIPSGQMQDAEPGTAYPVREFAEKMISISDNTATDHLLFRLGRKAVESVQSAMGHASPELNVPMISTREMTILKLGLKESQQQAYLDADPPTRRAILDRKLVSRKLPSIDPASWTEPVLIDSIEWFASPRDMGRAMLWLRDRMRTPKLQPLETILSVNPGLPLDRYAWSFVGYKGGSEPGVLNLTWLLRRLDERWFVCTLTLNDTQRNPEPMAATSLMPAAAALLVMQRKTPRKRR